MTTVSKAALHVVLHATGVSKCLQEPHLEVGWRNGYTTSPGCHGYDAVIEAVTAGLMEELRPSSVTEHACFRATTEGLRVARAHFAANRQARWSVTTEWGANTVYASTRSQARVRYAAIIQEAHGCTMLEALGEIRSVRLLDRPTPEVTP
jgi:hypothetical protein